MDEAPAVAVAAAGCPIVGIGASAGGLEAFETFFRACPVDSGMAFVLVPHLDPGHESLLTEILQRSTAMLLEVSRQAAFRLAIPAVRPEKAVNGMNQILLQLRASTGHDFSLYKKSTIARRIERRIVTALDAEPKA